MLGGWCMRSVVGLKSTPVLAADVVEASPALTPLFPDAANATEPLAGRQHSYIRRQVGCALS